MRHSFLVCGTLVLLTAACRDEQGRARSPQDVTNDSESSPDSQSESASQSASEGEDTDASLAEIVPDCSFCPAVGSTLDELRCAVDLCDDTVFLGQTYSSPVIQADKLDRSRAAVARFGDMSNDLAPLLNGTYALMATGPALGTSHSVSLSYDRVTDPFAKDGNTQVYDVVEWSLRLKAPPNARAFQIHYVFLSEEYDEFVGSEYNDRFYIFLEAPSTSLGEKTIINFTECRQGSYSGDFTCGPSMGDFCEPGQKYCHIAVNTALSECCWYAGCPSGTATTDLSGTGFGCATTENADDATTGSSTGWLVTSWPIEPGEEFTLTFHLHDTSDANYDSEVILDKFLFLSERFQGTRPL